MQAITKQLNWRKGRIFKRIWIRRFETFRSKDFNVGIRDFVLVIVHGIKEYRFERSVAEVVDKEKKVFQKGYAIQVMQLSVFRLCNYLWSIK